jgi:sn-glycerol 3-phosphate transport system permease protein
MEKRVVFDNRWLPYLLVAPQLLVTFVFFFWPAGQAIYQSAFIPDPFGLKTQFVGFGNFEYLFGNRFYRESFLTTAVFSVLVTVSAMSFALWLAVLADRLIKGSGAYRTLLIWPYAVAPAVAGVLWLFMFNPFTGVVSPGSRRSWVMTGTMSQRREAMALVVVASAWKQISYNFLFFLAGLQAIPKA